MPKPSMLKEAYRNIERQEALVANVGATDRQHRLEREMGVLVRLRSVAAFIEYYSHGRDPGPSRDHHDLE